MGHGSLLAFAALVALAACSQPAVDGAVEQDLEAGEQSQALTPVDTPPAEEPIEAPALAPVSRTDIEAQLEPGAGCSVEDDGKALLVAIEGDAIARPYGTLRHLEFEGDLDALWEGGVFTAGSIAITVELEDDQGERIENVTVFPATVTIAEDGQAGQAVYEGTTWECGA